MEDLAILMERVALARPRRIALAHAQKCLALHGFGHAFMAQYRAQKAVQGWLDFDDLIGRTAALLEDGRNNLLLGQPLGYTNPVKLLQGMQDAEVPWRHALRIVETVESPAVSLTLVKDGDHRLSRPGDLALLWRSLNGLLRPESV